MSQRLGIYCAEQTNKARCGKVPGEEVLSISQNLVFFFPAKLRQTSCGKVPGRKVLSNSSRLVVVRYEIEW